MLSTFLLTSPWAGGGGGRRRSGGGGGGVCGADGESNGWDYY